MRNPPHYLRFARSLALVGAMGLASCSDDDKPGTADTADSLSETVQTDTSPDVAPDVAPDTTADTSPDVAPDTIADTVADTTPDTTADTAEDTDDAAAMDIDTTLDVAVDCEKCDCGSADVSEACVTACCIAIGPLYPPDLPA